MTTAIGINPSLRRTSLTLRTLSELLDYAVLTEVRSWPSA